jgi:uncharacterized protein (DUF2141 family)
MKVSCGLAVSTAFMALSFPGSRAFSRAPATIEQSGNVATGCTLRIHVDGLRNSKGNVGTVVFTTSDGWPENSSKAFRIGPAEIPAGQRQATAVWENLPPGTYGVAAIHDENSNAKLDKNFLGIPKEGFGFANNPHVMFGPAPFKEALVHVTCPATDITIHIQYK